jgi:hypothetical protein
VVSRRLDHADITVTLGLHAHLLPGDDEAAAAAVAGAVLGSSVTNPRPRRDHAPCAVAIL